MTHPTDDMWQRWRWHAITCTKNCRGNHECGGCHCHDEDDPQDE